MTMYFSVNIPRTSTSILVHIIKSKFLRQVGEWKYIGYVILQDMSAHIYFFVKVIISTTTKLK